MNVNIINNPIWKNKKWFPFTNKNNIGSTRTDERFGNQASETIMNLFEIGKQYSVPLQNGRKALACMYNSPDTGDTRVVYAVSSDESHILKDIKLDGISQEEKDALLEIADAIVLEKYAG